MKKKTIISDDPFQKHYSYFLSEPMGKNFHDDFKPDLSPQEMLSLGVFGGYYFGYIPREFPSEWFREARISTQGRPDHSLNFFSVLASQSLSIWQKKGWINPADPRGWFQWYCRYYLGRRIPKEDERQIQRWKSFQRHGVQVQKNCRPGDRNCRPRQRQALLHWAYDSRNI